MRGVLANDRITLLHERPLPLASRNLSRTRLFPPSASVLPVESSYK